MSRAPYFEPFDDIYLEITARIKGHAASLADAKEGNWLCVIVDAFKSESDKWDAGGNHLLDEFCQHAAQLKLTLLQLTAGAYMHIAYDLPRVIVDNWPGEARWSPRPDEIQAELRYNALRPVFADVLMASANDSTRVGILSWPLPAKAAALKAAAHWISELRLAAWSNARLLHAQAPASRRETQKVMLQAVCAALKDSSIWKPWAFIDLDTPLIRTRSSVVTSYSLLPLGLFSHDQLPITVSTINLIATGVLIILGADYLLGRRNLSYLIRKFLESQERGTVLPEKIAEQAREAAFFEKEAEEAKQYIDELGLRTVDYVNAAVENPETFASFRKSYLALRPGYLGDATRRSLDEL